MLSEQDTYNQAAVEKRYSQSFGSLPLAVRWPQIAQMQARVNLAVKHYISLDLSLSLHLFYPHLDSPSSASNTVPGTGNLEAFLDLNCLCSLRDFHIIGS